MVIDPVPDILIEPVSPEIVLRVRTTHIPAVNVPPVVDVAFWSDINVTSIGPVGPVGPVGGLEEMVV
jgi:hypothetical protein